MLLFVKLPIIRRRTAFNEPTTLFKSCENDGISIKTDTK